MTSMPQVGSWRAEYASGDWTVLSGPASLVALSPGIDAGTASRLWEAVLAARDIDSLTSDLARLGAHEAPGLAVFFWADGEMRTLLRGDVAVSGDDGTPISQGETVRTWSETGLGDLRTISVRLGAAAAGDDSLPLVVGAVRAGSLRLDASEDALVLSPQLDGAPAAPVRAADPAPETPYLAAQPEPTTTPEPEHASPYPLPEPEPNGATAPQLEPDRARDWDPELPHTMIGPSLTPPVPAPVGAAGAAAPSAGHLTATQFGGTIADVAARKAYDEPTQPEFDEDELPGEPTQAMPLAAVPDDAEDVVLAVICPRGHPNPPDQRACRWCAEAIERQQPELVRTPALATIRPSSGAPVQLDRAVVIGRAPSAAKAATSDAHLLTVPSPSQDISRSHVLLTPVGWDVSVTDLESTNGTILLMAGGERRRLLPGQPLVVQTGSVVDLGDGVTVAIERPA